jgi:hypothetical protein
MPNFISRSFMCGDVNGELRLEFPEHGSLRESDFGSLFRERRLFVREWLNSPEFGRCVDTIRSLATSATTGALAKMNYEKF